MYDSLLLSNVVNVSMFFIRVRLRLTARSWQFVRFLLCVSEVEQRWLRNPVQCWPSTSCSTWFLTRKTAKDSKALRMRSRGGSFHSYLRESTVNKLVKRPKWFSILEQFDSISQYSLVLQLWAPHEQDYHWIEVRWDFMQLPNTSYCL